MVEFTDEQSVRDWLETRKIEEIVLFAGLAAARWFPWVVNDRDWANGHLDLRSARLILTTLVFSANASSEVKDAAEVAITAITAAYISVDSAASTSVAAGASTFAARAVGYPDASFIPAAASEAITAMRGLKSLAGSVGAYGADIFFAASNAATVLDQEGSMALSTTPLWAGGSPKRFSNDWALLKTERGRDRQTWGFWIDWYEGLLEGRAPDWEHWHDVVLIPDEHWGDPKAVADAIRKIQKDLAEKRKPKPADPEQVAGQALRLIAQPKTTRLVTTQAADSIDAAITEMLNAFQLNQLPASLAQLPGVADALRQIGDLSQTADRTAELEAQIAVLVERVSILSGEVHGLKAELAAKSGSNLSKIAREQFVKDSVSVLTKSFWGLIVGGGVVYATGIVDFPTAMERLSEFGANIEPPEPPAPYPGVNV